MTEPKTITALTTAFGPLDVSEFRGQTRVVVPRAAMFDALKMLKEQLGFDLLVDLTCVDYLLYREAKEPHNNSPLPRAAAARVGEGQGARAPRDRFGLVYLLSNTTTCQRITVRTFVNDPEPAVPSVVALWEGANWLEREVWDLFGIRFAGHPDLRRIVLPDEFTAHPLRKDYPLQGRGERHNLPVIRRGES
jgi:NADH-quinone oxidoreductase subunit C